MNDCIKYWNGWEKVEPAFHWEKYNLTVVGDSHDCQGNRFHLVKEGGYSGQMLGNASVWSETPVLELH
jgi:hypothetical protein